MPRWPAGLHRASGSGVAYGYRPIRPPATPQRQYWRRTATELHAGATAVIPVTQPGTGFPAPATGLPAVAVVGPQGAGEQWHVDLVQVQLGAQFGQPPGVIQQVVAQQQGLTTATPPPVVAQAWLCHSSVALQYQQWQTGKLLAQTTTGGNDALTVAAPLVTMGEVIAVVWYGWVGQSVTLPYMSVRGTRYALSVT